MNKLINIALLGAATLTACATPAAYDPILPFDAESTPISSLDVMPDALPEKATALDTPANYFAATNQISTNMINAGTASPAAAAGGGLLAGLIITAIDAGIDANRNSKFTTMLESQNFDGPAIFKEALENAMGGNNLPVNFASGTRVDRNLFSTDSLSKIENDAALDIRVTSYGYQISAGGWQPSVVADVVMKDPETGQTLMKERVIYGSPGAGGPGVITPYATTASSGFLGSSVVIVPYEEGYGFNSVDSFIEVEPKKAVKGIQLALSHTADAIANLIAQSPAPEAETAEPQDVAETVVEAIAEPVEILSEDVSEVIDTAEETAEVMTPEQGSLPAAPTEMADE